MRQVLHTSVLSQETCKSFFYGFVCIRPDFSTSVLDIEIYFIFPWSPCDDSSVADEGPREGRRLSLRQRGERRRGVQPELEPGVRTHPAHGRLVLLSPAGTHHPGGAGRTREVREPPQHWGTDRVPGVLTGPVWEHWAARCVLVPGASLALLLQSFSDQWTSTDMTVITCAKKNFKQSTRSQYVFQKYLKEFFPILLDNLFVFNDQFCIFFLLFFWCRYFWVWLLSNPVSLSPLKMENSSSDQIRISNLYTSLLQNSAPFLLCHH